MKQGLKSYFILARSKEHLHQHILRDLKFFLKYLEISDPILALEDEYNLSAGQISKMHYLGRSGLKVTNFIVMEGKDGLYFVFNDHIDNHAKDNDGTNMLKPKFTKKRVVSVYKIDSEDWLAVEWGLRVCCRFSR